MVFLKLYLVRIVLIESLLIILQGIYLKRLRHLTGKARVLGDQKEQAVRWLEMVDGDKKLDCYGSDTYRDGEKITDLLCFAKSQYEKRKNFLEENDKLEEELR